MYGMPVAQVVEPERVEIGAGRGCPLRRAVDHGGELAGEILVALAGRVPEQQRRLDMARQRAHEIIAVERPKADRPALIALADECHLSAVMIDLVTAGAQKFSLAGAH